MRRTWKKVLAVVLVCLTAFAVLQMTAFAADAQVVAQDHTIGYDIGQFLGAIVFSPVYLVEGLIWLVTLPFRLIFG